MDRIIRSALFVGPLTNMTGGQCAVSADWRLRYTVRQNSKASSAEQFAERVGLCPSGAEALVVFKAVSAGPEALLHPKPSFSANFEAGLRAVTKYREQASVRTLDEPKGILSQHG